MNYREVELLAKKTLSGASGTESIDIKVKDPITSIVVYFRVVNSTANVGESPPQGSLSKIELVDGGATYLSLTGHEAVAAACYDTGHWPMSYLNEKASGGQLIFIPILFGRYVGDPNFGFIPTNLVNPQLKITWANASGHTSGSSQLEVFAKVMEKGVAPSQILLWKEVKTFVSAGSGIEPVDLFTDYPYRRMMIRAYIADTAPWVTLTKFKLDCDAGKLIPLEMTQEEFRMLCLNTFGRFAYTKRDRFTTGNSWESWMGWTEIITAVPASPAIVSAYAGTGSQYTQYICDTSGVAITDKDVDVRIEGYLPESAWCYQFGRPDEPETWFNAPEFGDITLELTQALASADVSVLLQQPRSLP